jgi:hypothetical protein
MKKTLRIVMAIFLSSFLLSGPLTAQTILCVDRDFSDSAGVFTDTWPMISAALDAAGYTYDYHEVLDPGDNGPDATVMGGYDVVIWFTGEAWTDGQTMGPDDEFNLMLYMTLASGKLFLNAQDYLYDWYPSYGIFSPGEFPYDMLGIVEVVQDVYNIQDDPDTARFEGVPGSLAEGLSFPVRDIFSIPTEDGLYGDSIAQHMGHDLLSVSVPYVSPGPAAIQYETPGFRTVFSTIDIAAITDTVARDIYMHRIVDWLMYGATGTSELNPANVELLIMPNPVQDIVNIGLTETMIELFIYNNQGQLVHHERPGRNSIRMDLGDLGAGMYVVKVQTTRGMLTEKILKR